MREINLPDSINELVESLQVVELTWLGIPIQLPKFAVYAVIHRPVFDEFIKHKGRTIGLIKQGRYSIPVLDPFKGSLDTEPEYAVVVSHAKGNQFGLFGYPADEVDEHVNIPFYHREVDYIVKDFV